MKEYTQPQVWTTSTFDKLSRHYDFLMKSFYPIGEKGRERIVEKLDAGSVLDVACGTGTLLAMAAKKGLSCHGIDISQGMLEQARAKVPNAELKTASFYEIPYPDEQFDYVVATNALSGECIDTEKVLSEMIRVCKSNGEIYIAEWPKTPKENWMERLIVWLAKLNDDAPKDYLKIFGELGYEPEIDALRKRYHVFGITKKRKPD